MPTYLSEEETQRYDAFEKEKNSKLKKITPKNAEQKFQKAKKAFFDQLSSLDVTDETQVEKLCLTVSVLCHAASYIWAKNQKSTNKEKTFDSILASFGADKLTETLQDKLAPFEFQTPEKKGATPGRRGSYERMQDELTQNDFKKILKIPKIHISEGKAWEGLLLRAQYIAEICVPGIFPEPDHTSSVSHKKK